VQADWDSELFGKVFRGNVGLRGYKTDTRSTGWIQGNSYAYLGTADVKGSYSGVLPAMNSVLELTPDVLLRFSASKNLNRPGLGSIAARGTAFQQNTTCDFTKPVTKNNCDITASRGNPNLKPYTDVTLDLAVEYYFGESGLLSAGVFQKEIKNFITGLTLHDIPFSQTGVPFTTIPGATATTNVVDLDIPVNDPNKQTLTGLELAAQGQFSFLPAPFNNIGASANFTQLDKALLGISKTSYNFTLYYETKRWGVRSSLSHRTRWYSGYDASSVISADTRGFEGSTYVDAAAFVNLTDKFQLTLDAVNLTNEKDTQFWGQSRYLYNQNQSGTTYLAGASYKF
jgi:TonB-dependent receptor